MLRLVKVQSVEKRLIVARDGRQILLRLVKVQSVESVLLWPGMVERYHLMRYDQAKAVTHQMVPVYHFWPR